MDAKNQGRIFRWMLVVSFFFGLFGCSAQANEESLERGLILYMPMDGDLLDRVGHFHGRERNRADPLIFTSKSLFDSQGFAEAIYLDGQKQWIETDQGVDLLAYEEGFTLSLWVRPAEIIEQATGELSVTVPIISSGGRSDWELSMRDRGGFGGTSISFRMTAPITGVNAVDYDPGFPNWGDFNTQDVEVSLVREARKILPGKSAHFVIRGSAGRYDTLLEPIEKEIEMWVNGEHLGSASFPVAETERKGLFGGFRIRQQVNGFRAPNKLKLGASPFGGEALFNGRFDDLAMWSRALSEDEIACLWKNSKGAPVGSFLQDMDGDGLRDIWEASFGLDNTIDESEADPDNDGLANGQEQMLGTHPNNPDTDGDGLKDGIETQTGIWKSVTDTGTSPIQQDTDRDGIHDGRENPELAFKDANQPGTDPNERDTDEDGFEDRFEILDQTDPTQIDEKAQLARGLVSYWPFDGDLQDHWGRFHGKVSGTGSPSYVCEQHSDVSARFNQALRLDGEEQSVEIIAEAGAFDFSGESFTVSAWATPETNTPTLPTVIANGGRHPWLLGGFFTGDDSFSSDAQRFPNTGFVYFSPGTNQATGVTTFATQLTNDMAIVGDWKGHLFHMAGVYDADEQRFDVYVDARKVSTLTDNSGVGQVILGAESALHIGRAANYHSNITNWGGMIDDVAVWRRALDTNEIFFLFGRGQSLGELLELKTPQVLKLAQAPTVSRQNGHTSIQFPIEAANTYVIQYTHPMDDCAPWVWENVAEFSPSIDPFLRFEDDDPERLARQSGFYRVLKSKESNAPANGL